MSLHDDYYVISTRCGKTALAKLLLNSWYGAYPNAIYFDTDSIKCVYPLKGEKGDKEMSVMSTLSEKLNILAGELESELKNEYGAEVELHLSSKNERNSLSAYVKVIIIRDKREVGGMLVCIDLDTPIHEILQHVRDRFKTAKEFESYKKEKGINVDNLLDKITERNIENKVWLCKDTDSICMRSSYTGKGILCYQLQGETSFTNEKVSAIVNFFSWTHYEHFELNKYYKEFKSYVIKFMPEITVEDSYYEHEGDKYDLHAEVGYSYLSELDVKSFETIVEFESYYKRRKEAKLE